LQNVCSIHLLRIDYREKVRKRTIRDKEKEGLRRKKLEAESGTAILLLIDRGMKGIDVRQGWLDVQSSE